MATRVIKSNRQVVAARSKVLNKDIRGYHHVSEVLPEEGLYKSYTVVRLIVSGGKQGIGGRVLLTQVPASRKSSYVEPFVHAKTIQGVMVDRFTEAFLNVRVEGKTEGVADVVSGTIYSYEGGYYVAIQGGFYELIEQKTVSKDVIFDGEGKVREGVLVYGDSKKGCMTSSNGQVKKQEITLPCNNLPGFDYRTILNDLTFGLADILEKYPRKITKIKQVAQLSTRLAQVDAPAVEGLHVDVFAVYMGIYSDLWDGQIYLQDAYVADWYADRLGEQFSVLCKAVRGITLQCRPYMCKGNGSVVSKEYLNDFLRAHYAGDVIILKRDELTLEDQIAFNEAIWSKGKEGKFAGKLVILCDNTEQAMSKGVQVYTDLNGLKETFNLSRRSGLNVLDTTEESEDINTSTQTFATFMVANEERAHDLFMEKCENVVESVFQQVMAEQGMSATFDEVSNSMSPMQLGGKLFPHFLREHWTPGYRQIVNNAIEGLANRIAKCNLVNEGAYDVFVVDACLDFGFEGLKFENNICEVFCKDINRDSMLVRFPKANAYGFSIVRPVTVETIVERAVAAGVPAHRIELLKDRLNEQSEGIVMLPASQSLMDKHDGHDFDGDHGQLTSDQETVDIVKGKTSMIVHICEDMEDYVAGVKKHQK